MDKKKHLAQALRWTSETEMDSVEMITSCIGMAGPVLFSAVLGQLPLGMVVSLSGLAVGGVKAEASMKNQAREWAYALLPAVFAANAAFLLVDHGWISDAAVILLAVIAAVAGGYSRDLVVSTTRFILFLTIAVNVFSAAEHPAVLLLLILAGALWRSCISLIAAKLVHRQHRVEAVSNGTSVLPTTSQKFARWKKSLTQLSGWQYALRLGVCLCAAERLRWIWPHHHFYWIVLTVAILIERKAEPIPIKTIQRVLGTVIGVMAVSLIFVVSLPVWGLVVIVGLLAALRPLLKARNYLLYAASMTPLIFLLMSAGQTLEWAVLIDRIMATCIGACLVVLVNLAATRVLGKERA